MKKAGRPSKAVLQEREQRRKAWRREEKRNEELYLQIDRDIDHGIEPPWNDLITRLSPEKRALFETWLESPALRYMIKRVGLPKSATWRTWHVAWRKAICELLRSDLPLDQRMRHQVAEEIEKLVSPAEAEHAVVRMKVSLIKGSLATRERRGESPEDAYEHVAEEFGHKSGESLRKWLKAHDPDEQEIRKK
jgi:hypothetical protein